MTVAGKSSRIPWHTVDLAGTPANAIAAALGIHRVTVYARRRAVGIAPPSGSRRPWTPAEDEQLAELYWADWSTRGRRALAAQLGRTEGGLRRRAEVLELPERARAVPDQWPKCVRQISRETGYPPWRITQAARRVGTRLRRGARARHHFAITERQAKKILAELARYPDGANMHVRRQKEWRRGQRCVVCGSTRLPRMARETCSGCYMRALRARKRAAAPEAAT